MTYRRRAYGTATTLGLAINVHAVNDKRWTTVEEPIGQAGCWLERLRARLVKKTASSPAATTAGGRESQK